MHCGSQWRTSHAHAPMLKCTHASPHLIVRDRRCPPKKLEGSNCFVLWFVSTKLFALLERPARGKKCCGSCAAAEGVPHILSALIMMGGCAAAGRATHLKRTHHDGRLCHSRGRATHLERTHHDGQLCRSRACHTS